MSIFDNQYAALLTFIGEKCHLQIDYDEGNEVCRCSMADFYSEYCDFSQYNPSKTSVFPLLMNKLIIDNPDYGIYKKKVEKHYYYGITLIDSPDFPELAKRQRSERRKKVSRYVRSQPGGNNRIPLTPPEDTQKEVIDTIKSKDPPVPSILNRYGYNPSPVTIPKIVLEPQ